jgi:3-hydroxyacyl-[acyl-carrier-protein] dehydratase
MIHQMLKDSFYSILSIVPSDYKNDALVADTGVFTARIKLNEQHPVYLGHFPGNPVVPGVCQIQMIKEIFSEIVHKEVLLVNSDNIKFLTIIVPEKYPELDIRISIKKQLEGQWDVTGTIANDNTLFLKFKGIFREQ